MQLYIDTSKNEYFRLSLKQGEQLLDKSKTKAKFKQSEKLLVAIDELLEKNKVEIKQVKKIIVNDEGDGFSTLRIGVVTANALAYALNIEVVGVSENNIKIKDFSMVKPNYSQEPNIG